MINYWETEDEEEESACETDFTEDDKTNDSVVMRD